MRTAVFARIVLLSAGLILVHAAASAQVVTTLAGSGQIGSLDGNGAQASFAVPQGVTVDPLGNVYVADTGSLKIRKISPNGLVTTIAGDGRSGYEDGTRARFFGPLGVAADPSGNVWVADSDDGWDGQWVKKITPDGVLYNLRLYPFFYPIAVATDKIGNLYVLDYNAGLWKIPAGSRSPAALVSRTSGAGVAVDGAGNAYVADRINRKVWKITPDGVATTLAASFSGPTGLAVDSSGTVYVADRDSNRIRKITPAGFVTTVAGSGNPGSVDGTGTAASFDSPTGVALDASGNLYVADSGNNRIRKITFSGVLDMSVGADSLTRLLHFDALTGQMAFVPVGETGGFPTGPFGPYREWTARRTAAGADGLTRVLWTNENGSAALWLVGGEGNRASHLLRGTPGWSAVDVTTSVPGLSHVLWGNAEGRAALWSVDNAGTISAGAAFGLSAGWTASAVADAPDGISRVLWNRFDGSAALSVWGPQGPLATSTFGPVAGWTAADIAVGVDGQTRILWTHRDRRMALWRVDAAGNPTVLGPVYAPPAGFSASRVAAGADGLTRVLWTDVNGAAVVWVLSADNVLEESFSVLSTR